MRRDGAETRAVALDGVRVPERDPRVVADALLVASVRTTGMRWIVKESAPTSDTMASVTEAFSPWMSDTTAMIDVTATMLPSTVMNERSLLAQMACSAIAADFEELVHCAGAPVTRGACSTLTASPSARSRTELNGPMMTCRRP